MPSRAECVRIRIRSSSADVWLIFYSDITQACNLVLCKFDVCRLQCMKGLNFSWFEACKIKTHNIMSLNIVEKIWPIPYVNRFQSKHITYMSGCAINNNGLHHMKYNVSI